VAFSFSKPDIPRPPTTPLCGIDRIRAERVSDDDALRALSRRCYCELGYFFRHLVGIWRIDAPKHALHELEKSILNLSNLAYSFVRSPSPALRCPDRPVG
jgi:hypothetical protein